MLASLSLTLIYRHRLAQNGHALGFDRALNNYLVITLQSNATFLKAKRKIPSLFLSLGFFLVPIAGIELAT
jgi:hypothetical protein